MSTDEIVGTGVEWLQHTVAGAACSCRVHPTRLIGRVEVDRHAPAFPTDTAPADDSVGAAATLTYTPCDAGGRGAHAR